MDIINIKKHDEYLNEYIILCNKEWGSNIADGKYVASKKNRILFSDKVIIILGLVDDHNLIGFISLFKYDGEERKDLTPWYATMYVKNEYRGLGYSKILNNAILKEALKLGYKKVYLKTNLTNYYEKFGAKYLEDLPSGEKLYYIDLKDSL